MIALLTLLGVHMFNNLLNHYQVHFIFRRLSCVFGYLYGPFFLGYIRGLMYQDFKLKRIDALHLLPTFISLGLSLSNPQFCQQWSFLILVSIGIYQIVAFVQVIQYRKVLKNTRANFQHIDFSWMWQILLFFIAIFAADFLGAFYKYTEILTFLLLLGFVNLLVYRGLKHSSAFGGITQNDQQNMGIQLPAQQEVTPPQNLQKLLDFMQNAQPFLNPDIHIQQLADEVGIPAREVSQMINQHLKQNFSEFINNYRIEMAKQRLENPQDDKETVQEVMYEVGFNSKSVFNTYFKKKTGMTPTQYKLKVKNEK